MKTLKFTFLIIVAAFLICSNALKAQTVQNELRSSFTNVMAWCLNRPISGELVYHFTYHLDRKTGKVDRIHWETSHSNIWDAVTGEKYKTIDVGMDNGGSQWEFWNNINDYTQGYEIENGWLPVPDNLPIEGSAVAMNFKFIGKGGEVYSMKFMWQLHRNASGEIIVDKNISYADCN